ncbi:hypothetical protein [Campylobacter magnus]|nr:hypothetical protein [Campylobacter magnus]MDD0856139.1 hypothetical protein [Campylobacter magnus]
MKIFFKMRLFHHFRLFCVSFVLKTTIFNTKNYKSPSNDEIAVLCGLC